MVQASHLFGTHFIIEATLQPEEKKRGSLLFKSSVSFVRTLISPLHEDTILWEHHLVPTTFAIPKR